MLDKVGVPIDKIGDSTGKLEGLSEIWTQELRS